MNTVLASIDGSSASVAVLDVGSGISDVVEGRLEVLHVDVGAPMRALFHTQGLQASLTIARGDPVGEIVRSATRAEVTFLVIALRDRVLARDSIGRTTDAVISRIPKGVIVVPPVIAPWPDHPHIRVLVPAGDRRSHPSGSPELALLRDAGAEIIVARPGAPGRNHHDASNESKDGADGAPTVHPGRAQPGLTDSTTPSALVAAAEGVLADLIAFPLTRPSDVDQRAFVQAVLASSRTPVLLLPSPSDPKRP